MVTARWSSAGTRDVRLGIRLAPGTGLRSQPGSTDRDRGFKTGEQRPPARRAAARFRAHGVDSATGSAPAMVGGATTWRWRTSARATAAGFAPSRSISISTCPMAANRDSGHGGRARTRRRARRRSNPPRAMTITRVLRLNAAAARSMSRRPSTQRNRSAARPAADPRHRPPGSDADAGRPLAVGARRFRSVPSWMHSTVSWPRIRCSVRARCGARMFPGVTTRHRRSMSR